MQIKKAKLSDGTLEVSFTERLEDGTKKTVTESYDRKAHPDLIQAFQNFAIHWAILCGYVAVSKVKNVETPKDEQVEGITITGISIKTGDDSGVVITGHKKLETGKAVNINTPFQRYNESDETAYKFVDDLIEKVDRSNAEVSAYIDGTKVADDPQGVLFSDNANVAPQNRLPEDIESEDVPGSATIDPNATTAQQIEQRLEDKSIWKDGKRPEVTGQMTA